MDRIEQPDLTPEERARRAKQPLSAVAGPAGHPFHPILVTIPIGAWIASLIFDIISRQSESPEAFTRGAYWLIGIGVIGAFIAGVFGLLDMQNIAKGTRAHRTARLHLILNTLVVVAFTVSWIIRVARTDVETPLWLLFASVAILGVLGISGWLGGTLSYRYGVRVVPEEKQVDGFTETRAARRAAAKEADATLDGEQPPGEGEERRPA